jgi:hypothetical protein
LDVFLGLTFFKFPNLGASWFQFWGYSFDQGWRKVIPIEEIGFYVFGFIAMLLVYIWGDEYWYAAYCPKRDVRQSPVPLRAWLSFHPTSLAVGVALFAAAYAYKKHGPHEYHEGFPGYFLFMLVACILPSALFLPIAKPFINWRAFSLSFFFVLLVSIFWEAGLALPYQWWDYHHAQMMGIFIGAFTNLPLEAVLLWMFASGTTVIVYELVHARLRSRLGEVGAGSRYDGSRSERRERYPGSDSA